MQFEFIYGCIEKFTYHTEMCIFVSLSLFWLLCHRTTEIKHTEMSWPVSSVSDKKVLSLNFV